MRRALLVGGAAGLSFLFLFLCTLTCSADVWYLDDGHPAGIWGTTDQHGTFYPVESMADGCLSGKVSAFLDPDTTYVAQTQELTGDYFGETFQGVLYMHNYYSSQSFPVICALKVTQGLGWATIGTDTVNVTHDGLPPPMMGPIQHHFHFGVCNVPTMGEMLQLNINYATASSDTAHTYLFWDGAGYSSSAVHCYSGTTPTDHVVCEYYSGTPPPHPPTYWYEVTPIGTRRDFHVRVYDGGNISDYSNWVEPEGWAHTIHTVNCQRWVSWYAPTAVESLGAYAAYQFGFTNSHPATWGEWATTTSGTTNPHVSVADSSGAHMGQPNGYGRRVHVPKKPADGGMPAITPLPDGYWEGDARFDEYDGVAILAICGETDSGNETGIYQWNGTDFDFLQALEGVKSEGSGALDWGDFNNDGQPDLAISGMNNDATRVTRVYRGDGGTLVWDGDELTGLSHASVAWGDYDMDGLADLLTMGHDGVARRAIIYEHDGMGSFTVVGELEGLTSGSADWADIDGDGDPDLVTTGSDGAVRRTIFYEGNPSALPTPVGDLGLPGIALSDAEWCDYDRDGDPDLAFTGETSSQEKMARVYRNDGGMVFTVVADLLSVYRSSCAWGDYNLDGDVDIAFCGYDGSSLHTRIFENTGDGFTDSGFSFPGSREGALCFYDFDGDCDCDFFLCGADWSDKHGRPYENTAFDFVGVPGDEVVPALADGRLLDVNYPNPFNPSTRIRFVVPEDGDVKLAIYDVSGRLVRTLVRASLAASAYEMTWSGVDDDGHRVASGVYFAHLTCEAGSDTRKLMLIK